jgi:hypothetical protein
MYILLIVFLIHIVILSNLLRNAATMETKIKWGRPILQNQLQEMSMMTNLSYSVPMFIITNFYSDPEDIAKRKAVLISGRVHPG